jgi:hypothetical protein
MNDSHQAMAHGDRIREEIKEMLIGRGGYLLNKNTLN